MIQATSNALRQQVMNSEGWANTVQRESVLTVFDKFVVDSSTAREGGQTATGDNGLGQEQKAAPYQWKESRSGRGTE